MAMTPSDLDEIRKRCEANGEPGRVVAMATAELIALLDEVERLQDKLRVSEEQFDALGDANVLGIENERLREQLRHMKKHIAHNDDEYRVMKDVLRAEHQACQELRAEVERLNRIVAAPPGCSGCGVELGDSWCAKCATEAERDRLQAEVERLRDQLHMIQGDALTAVGEVDALQSRLALLEPVWEAAKRWSEIDHGADDRDDWCDENCPKRQAEDILYAFVVGAIDKEQAIDAAVAKEGK